MVRNDGKSMRNNLNIVSDSDIFHHLNVNKRPKSRNIEGSFGKYCESNLHFLFISFQDHFLSDLKINFSFLSGMRRKIIYGAVAFKYNLLRNNMTFSTCVY